MKRLTNWIEIPVLDIQRARDFYETILGIEMQPMTVGDSEYALFPSDDQFNNGALAQGAYYKPSADGVTIYLNGGEDLSKILDKVKEAGGEVIMEKTLLAPETGYVGMFMDSEGNRVGLQHM